MVKFLARKAVFVLAFTILSVSALAEDKKKTFDHSRTGFDLDGVHRTLSCNNCHIEGKFKGTPRDCVGCHSLNGLTNASARSAAHVQTTQDCGACHLPTIWEDMFRVDHTQVLGSCASCHQDGGVVATGRSSANFVHTGSTTRTCNECHSTLDWLPANVDHSQAGTGQVCQLCHNGSVATGQFSNSFNHLPTLQPAECDACHSTLVWEPIVTFDHRQTPAEDGQCRICHSGAFAEAQPVFHDALVAVSAGLDAGTPCSTAARECGACHNFNVSWNNSPAAFCAP